MPVSFPPGTDQSVNPGVTPQWVFSPPSGVPSTTLGLTNTGRWPVFAGGAGVTQYNGLPILPGTRIEMKGVLQPVYVASGVTSLVVQGTVSATAVTAGSTALTMTATVPTALAAGTYVVIGNTANTGGCQPQLVASTTASSQITFANALVLDVANGDVVYSATYQPAQVRVTAGVV